MNTADLIILILLAVLLGGIIVGMIRRSRHSSGCGGCEGCAARGSCEKEKNKWQKREPDVK